MLNPLISRRKGRKGRNMHFRLTNLFCSILEADISRGTISRENGNYQKIMGFNMENFTVVL